MRDNGAGLCQPRRFFDQLFESVVDGFAKFGRNDDSFDDAVPLLIGQASEVCRRSVTLPDSALHDARADSQQLGLVGFDCLSLPGCQLAALDESVEPNGIEGWQVSGKCLHSGRTAAKIAG